MPFKEIESPSLKDLFIREVEGMILSGELKIGDRLPTERELAEKMRVSRAVVNGGITELARKGFLEVTPRKGIHVADYKRCGKLDTLEAILAYNGGRFTPEMLRSILGVRRSIQVDIVRLVASRRTEEELKALQELYSQIEKTEDPAALSELIFQFEHSCSVMSGNMIYPLINYAFRASYTSLMLITCKEPLRGERVMWVRRLLKCIELKRPDEAVQCIEDSNIWCMEAIGQSYSPEERYFT